MQYPIRTELHFPINVKYSLQNKVYLSIASIRSEMLHMYGNYVYVSFMGFLLFSYSKSDFTIIIHQKKKNSMAPFIVYLMFMTISQTCVVAMSSKTYEARLELFNRVSVYIRTVRTQTFGFCSWMQRVMWNWMQLLQL